MLVLRSAVDPKIVYGRQTQTHCKKININDLRNVIEVLTRCKIWRPFMKAPSVL